MAEYRRSAHAVFDLKYHVVWITVDATDSVTIKTYIENQKWDEDDQGFKITGPAEP